MHYIFHVNYWEVILFLSHIAFSSYNCCHIILNVRDGIRQERFSKSCLIFFFIYSRPWLYTVYVMNQNTKLKCCRVYTNRINTIKNCLIARFKIEKYLFNVILIRIFTKLNNNASKKTKVNIKTSSYHLLLWNCTK